MQNAPDMDPNIVTSTLKNKQKNVKPVGKITITVSIFYIQYVYWTNSSLRN